MVIHKAEELVQEVNRLRTKSTTVETHLGSVEVDFRTCKDSLDRISSEKDQLQRQVATQLIDLDRFRQVCHKFYNQRSHFKKKNFPLKRYLKQTVSWSEKKYFLYENINIDSIILIRIRFINFNSKKQNHFWFFFYIEIDIV